MEYLNLSKEKTSNFMLSRIGLGSMRMGDVSEGNYEAEIFADGINADREATDYKKEVCIVTAKDKLNVQLAPGGGWTARITKK